MSSPPPVSPPPACPGGRAKASDLSDPTRYPQPGERELPSRPDQTRTREKREDAEGGEGHGRENGWPRRIKSPLLPRARGPQPASALETCGSTEHVRPAATEGRSDSALRVLPAPGGKGRGGVAAPPGARDWRRVGRWVGVLLRIALGRFAGSCEQIGSTFEAPRSHSALTPLI